MICAQGVLKGNTGAIKRPSGIRSIALTPAVCCNPELCILYGTCSAHCSHEGRLKASLSYIGGKWSAMQLAMPDALCCCARVPEALQKFMPNNMAFIPFRKRKDAKGRFMPI